MVIDIIPDREKRETAALLWDEYMRLCNIDDCSEASDAAFKAWEDGSEVDLLLDYAGEGRVIRCAITGVPLLETDDVVMVLRSALPAK